MGKKQINSKRGVYDGIKFASQLEISCYKLLKEAGIDFEYEGEVFELMSEFHLENVFPLRWKMFLNTIFQTNDKRAIYMPTTKADCQLVVEDILKRFY